MPTTFQKNMDKTLESVHSKFAILDDILIITKGSLNDHEQEIDKVLNQLDKENIAIKLQKCEFAKPNLTWLGYKKTSKWNNPITKKMRIDFKIRNPKTLKQLRSFRGCI